MYEYPLKRHKKKLSAIFMCRNNFFIYYKTS